MTTRPFSRCRRAPQRDVRFGDLTHGDGGLHAGVDAFLLQEVLQCKAVHRRCRACPCSRCGCAPCRAAATGRPGRSFRRHDDGHLGAAADDVGDLPGHQAPPHRGRVRPARHRTSRRRASAAPAKYAGRMTPGPAVVWLRHQTPRCPDTESPPRRIRADGLTNPASSRRLGHVRVAGRGGSIRARSAQVCGQQPRPDRPAAVALIARCR